MRQGDLRPLYHGSPRKLKTLNPRQEHGDPRVPGAVFASPSETFASAYTGRKWGDRDINQSYRGGKKNRRMILREMRPGALQDVYGGKEGYLYEVPKEPFEALKGRRSSYEVVSKKPVRPTKTEVIPDVLARLKRTPGLELASYDPKAPETRAEIRRSIKRMREMDDGGVKYKKWRLEVAPPEVKRMFAEEEKLAARAGFLDELSKIAQSPQGRGLMSDFLGGVDPTGTSTFQYGMQDAKSGDPSKLRQAVGAAGGVVGGALAIPAAVGGTVGAIKGFAGGRGGVRGRLLQAGREAWSGAAQPYTSLYRGVQGRRALSAHQAGKTLTDRQAGHLQNLVKDVTPLGMVTPRHVAGAKQQMSGGIAGAKQQLSGARKQLSEELAGRVDAMGMPAIARERAARLQGAAEGQVSRLQGAAEGQAGRLQEAVNTAQPRKFTAAETQDFLKQMDPNQLAEAKRRLTGEIAGGAGALGLSGAISGGSAYMQYGKGARTQQDVNQQLAARRGARPVGR